MPIHVWDTSSRPEKFLRRRLAEEVHESATGFLEYQKWQGEQVGGSSMKAVT